MAAGPTIAAKFIADTSKMTDEVDKATSNMASSLGSFAKKAAMALAGAFVVDKVIDFGKASVEAAMADAEAQDKLAITLMNVTGATEDQIAASEEFIGKLSKQAAIADDDLRPAYDKLVRGFGDAEKAQKALSLATNVSAGTGKDLASVTDAMMKAALGNTGALGKMGIAVKNADGKAKSLDQIMKDMADTFGGQATAAATTAAGQMRNASIQFGEFQEQIGAKLMPVLAALAGFFMDTVIPALDSLFNTIVGSDAFKSFTDFIENTLVPALQKAGEWFGKVVAPAVGEFITDTLVPALQKAADWIGKVAAPAVTDWFNNTLIPAVKDTAKWITETLIPALEDAVKAIDESGAWKAFVATAETLSKLTFDVLVNAFGFIKDTMLPLMGTMAEKLNENKDILVSALGAIGIMLIATNIGMVTLIPTAVGLFGLWVAGAVSAAIATAAAALPFVLIGLAIAALILIVIRNWDTIVDATKWAWEKLKAIVTTLWDWIQNVFGWIVAGIQGYIADIAAIWTGAWDGIKSVVTTLWDWIQNVFGWIVNGVKGYVNDIIGLWTGAWDGIKNGATSVWQFVTDKFQAIADFFHGLIDKIGATAGAIVEAIKKPINSIIGLWNGLAFEIPTIGIPEVDLGPLGKHGGGTLGGFKIDFPDLPLLARGGVLTHPTLFVGGEAGTEIVAPEDMLRSIVNEEAGGTYILNMYPRTADASDIAYGFRRLELLAGLP